MIKWLSSLQRTLRQLRRTLIKRLRSLQSSLCELGRTLIKGLRGLQGPGVERLRLSAHLLTGLNGLLRQASGAGKILLTRTKTSLCEPRHLPHVRRRRSHRIADILRGGVLITLLLSKTGLLQRHILLLSRTASIGNIHGILNSSILCLLLLRITLLLQSCVTLQIGLCRCSNIANILGSGLLIPLLLRKTLLLQSSITLHEGSRRTHGIANVLARSLIVSGSLLLGLTNALKRGHIDALRLSLSAKRSVSASGLSILPNIDGLIGRTLKGVDVGHASLLAGGQRRNKRLWRIGVGRKRRSGYIFRTSIDGVIAGQNFRRNRYGLSAGCTFAATAIKFGVNARRQSPTSIAKAKIVLLAKRKEGVAHLNAP